jgi:predicted regulator of Ras-like GTPase activity (Roadblock/LC7/MglB family)
MAMTIPFLDLVKRAREKFDGRHRRPAGPVPLPSVEDKPQSDKLAKRVTPYAVRTMTPEPTAPALAAASAIATRRISATRQSAAEFGPSVGGVSVDPRGERTVSLALSDVIAEMPNGYLKPRESFDTSRRITLKAAEVEKGLAAGRPGISIAAIYQQVPEIFLHTVQPSDTAVVMLPAKKVIDELSHLRVREDQTAEPIMAQVETPFLKMMVEESAKFGTTLAPFTTTELPSLPEPVSRAPAAAEPAPVAAIRPSPARLPVQPPPAMKLPVEPPPAPGLSAQPPPVAPATNRTIPPPRVETEPTRDGSMARITFVAPSAPAENKPEKPLPIGTGGPAFPRVPASSGPPVPPAAPPPAAPPAAAPPTAAPPPAAPPTAAPTRIPFQMPPLAVPPKIAAQTPAPAPPTASVPVQETPKVTPVAATSIEPAGETMVVLPLCPILASLPPMQLAGDVASVPADAKISFRMGLIAPQLATGKVTIPPKDFHAALPEQYRALFLPDVVEAPVQLSLPDVLANLPGDSLRMREDQEVTTHDEAFETPFSAKAKEDAERFAQGHKTALPSATVLPKPEVPKAETPKIELPKVAEPQVPKVTIPDLRVPKVAAPNVEAAKVELSARVDPVGIAVVPTAKAEPAMPAEEAPKFDAKTAIAEACALPGVASCSVIFADGLIIAGNIPDEMHMEGLSAVAPTMLKKLQKHMCETQLGPLSCITVHGEKSPVTFFSAGALCLTAVHNGFELSAASRRELSRITQELSRTYPQVETPHVDH